LEQDTFIKFFHRSTCDRVISADKMMIRALGPVWHRKQREQGIIPKGLTGLDTEATWGYSKSDGWVYGHGTFCLVACRSRMLGAFKWMRNSGNEAKRMWLETGKLKGLISTVLMDSKADDQALFFELQRQRGIQRQKKNQRLYKQRSYTVEPMQGLVKEIFDLERCWMRGDENNRWIFAAMGVTVQMHQYRAWQAGRSTWEVESVGILLIRHSSGPHVSPTAGPGRRLAK
jgi:hypothetical protein